MSGVAVVTGAGSGIGEAVARGLLDAGWRVALAGRRADRLDAVAAGHTGALAVATDVADPDSVAALFAAVRERWGRVDLLVNNAGTFGPGGTVDEIAVDAWRDTVAVNLTGSFLCAREAFAAMRAQDPQGGRIINNGSISAHVPRPGSAAYTATKHAITGLTKSLSLDGREFGIACGQIDIGNAATDMTAGIATGARQADGTTRPEPTFDVAHVAEAVTYMAGLPLGANVQFLTIAATAMPWLARG
ncbi:3-oxoacyl-ACP reductase [Pseudonocardia sp. EC080610-09]|uniref:SDR family oxidoreductase n=1 Tax=unclassified Pseudonocardia TaxID=2619320 RepID=UPI0006CB1001|nr:MULTISPECIES: SDR family oxidoreductase [unclassified Pseudonocardia]ALE75702.1 3-oxoacyl-ACP reductase [Pseudonocardia sp. EC080625-04]ALL75086.1 3-oxoacyl-ACP reductase [Pseudonocardia sp. EC080610-09]ALL82108.1 3-oxoacyl-ACP reductase [Pseudonocardia sp. EC080619-01]